MLEKLIVAAPGGGASAVAISAAGGAAIRDAVVIGADGSGLSITNGSANELVRSTVLAAAASGRAVEMQLGTSPANLSIDSSVLSGGASGVGLFVKTGVGTLPLGGAGSANITARHVTIAGSATAISLDSSDAAGLLSPVGNIAVTVRDAIVLGSNPAVTNPGLLVLPPNTASLSLTRTDQTSAPEALFANPARRNYHLRADAPVIDKGQVTASDSPTDVDSQPRTSGAASDLGADEFVNSPPTAKIAMKTPSPRAGQPITLDGSESSDREAGIGGPITEYRWTFGDGVTQTTTTPTVEHAYGGPGAVVAELVVADRNGGVSAPASVSFQLANATPPTVLITKPKPSAKIALRTKQRKRAKITFSGTAKAEAGIRNVVLTIEKLGTSKKTCTWLDKKQGLIKGVCSRPVLINAKISPGTWSYTVASSIRLTKGSYRVSVYGVDASGSFGNTAPTRSRIVRFTLR